MAIKDGITSWFIQNIVIPNAEDIRNPGYIISKFSDKNKQVSIREFFFPEKFYQVFETSIASKLGKKGEKRLYSIGKRFGYRYAKISRYGNTSTMKKNDIEGFMYLFMRYIEVIYANKIEHKIDVEKKYLEIEADAYAGCEGNGLGYILLIGAGTGVWSYLMNDSKVDGYQITCQGRGDKLCKLVCAPINELKKLAKNAISEENVEGLDENYQKYEVLNKVYPTINKNLSLKELIENKIFKYEKGKLFFQKQRMVG